MATGRTRRGSGRQTGGWRVRAARLLRLAIAVIALFALLPPALVLVYAVDGIRPVSTLMIGRTLMMKPVDRRWVPFSDISPLLAHSVLMSEDGQFCSHRGVDWRELNAVIDDALGGEPTRGASTLPMQTVKNLFLWPGRSYVRKAVEIPLAMFADLVWSKRRMMEIYLNIAEWDEGVFGAEAAARHYFGRSADRLSARQSALLAVTLPNPAARNPANPSARLSRLAGVVERRARKAGGYIGCLTGP